MCYTNEIPLSIHFLSLMLGRVCVHPFFPVDCCVWPFLYVGLLTVFGSYLLEVMKSLELPICIHKWMFLQDKCRRGICQVGGKISFHFNHRCQVALSTGHWPWAKEVISHPQQHLLFIRLSTFFSSICSSDLYSTSFFLFSSQKWHSHTIPHRGFM